MRVLLTGASGFVGSHLLRRLVAEGRRHEVAVLLRASSPTWRIDDLLGRVQRIEGTLDDLADARAAVVAFAPEAVVHLAWSGVAASSRNDPGQADNIASTLALVRLAHEAGARTWIGLGSQAEYGPSQAPTGEDAPTLPTTLYGVAKLAACRFAATLCRDLGMRFAWLRLFSSYGPGDDPAWMLPTLIRTLLAGARPALTAGTQRWDYLYVDDAARALALTIEAPDASGVFNLGSGRALPIARVVERVRDLIDPKLPLGFGEVAFRPDQVMHLEADVRRLREATGWTPAVALDEGLRRTVAWHREHGGAHGS